VTYQSSGLSAISYANGFTLWHYRTPDELAEVLSYGYFATASKMLRPGDFIMLNASMGVEALEHAVLVVVSTSPSHVDVKRMVAAGGPE
jgi:hypothetical protein